MHTVDVLQDLVETCRAVLPRDEPRRAIHDAMKDLLADPAGLADQIPRFAEDEVATSVRGWRLGGEHIVHQQSDLTVMVLDTLPGVMQPPHEHNMAAFIGVFEGCEVQRFWRRTEDGIVTTAGRSLEAGEVLSFGAKAIHAINAPDERPARAVHVYLGDIYDVERSVFHPDSLAEHDMTGDRYDEFCRPSNNSGE